jgi:hypothetical protein
MNTATIDNLFRIERAAKEHLAVFMRPFFLSTLSSVLPEEVHSTSPRENGTPRRYGTSHGTATTDHRLRTTGNMGVFVFYRRCRAQKWGKT